MSPTGDVARLLSRLMATLRRQSIDDQDWLDQAADLGRDRLDRYQLYQDYYDGEHSTYLTDRAKRFLQRNGIVFSENFCETIVDSLADRLRVTGFTTSAALEEESESGVMIRVDPVSEWLGEQWQANRMDAEQGVIHTRLLTLGDAFALVSWDNLRGRPRVTSQPTASCKAVYSDEHPDELEYAVKRWNGKDAEGKEVVRLNVYWPDRLEKWWRPHRDDGAGGWRRWRDPDDEAWPVPLIIGGQPLGIPIVHFRNKPLGGQYGRSELRGVIPQQDLLNKLCIDLATVLDYYGSPDRWVTGLENFDGKHAIGNWFTASSAEAKFGQFDAANPEGALRAIDDLLARMAKRSRTPMHLLTGGDMPSGEALKSAESGLVSKATDRQTLFGNCWEDVARLCLRLAAGFGELPPEAAPLAAGEGTVETQWRGAESRSEKEDAETSVLLLELGLSKATALARLGYDPDEEARKKAREQEQAQGRERMAQEELARMMDRGEMADGGETMGG